MLRFLKKYKYVITIFLFMLIIFYIVFVKVNLKSKEKNLVDNQVIRCIKLDSLLSKRKKFIKDENYLLENENVF